jgi:hypothetical protein
MSKYGADDTYCLPVTIHAEYRGLPDHLLSDHPLIDDIFHVVIASERLTVMRCGHFIVGGRDMRWPDSDVHPAD